MYNVTNLIGSEEPEGGDLRIWEILQIRSPWGRTYPRKLIWSVGASTSAANWTAVFDFYHKSAIVFGGEVAEPLPKGYPEMVTRMSGFHRCFCCMQLDCRKIWTIFGLVKSIHKISSSILYQNQSHYHNQQKNKKIVSNKGINQIPLLFNIITNSKEGLYMKLNNLCKWFDLKLVFEDLWFKKERFGKGM